jgi:hypothetical protein
MKKSAETFSNGGLMLLQLVRKNFLFAAPTLEFRHRPCQGPQPAAEGEVAMAVAAPIVRFSLGKTQVMQLTHTMRQSSSRNRSTFARNSPLQKLTTVLPRKPGTEARFSGPAT